MWKPRRRQIGSIGSTREGSEQVSDQKVQVAVTLTCILTIPARKKARRDLALIGEAGPSNPAETFESHINAQADAIPVDLDLDLQCKSCSGASFNIPTVLI
jgi:hypothetical protein